MNFGDLRAQFAALLNRSDCTTDQSNIFLVQAMQRIAREARLPCMERMALFSPSDPMESIPIPGDMIELIDIYVQSDTTNIDTMLALKKLPYRELIRKPSAGPALFYARLQAAYHVRGLIAEGSSVQLVYYGEFSPLSGDTDENEITASSPDVIVYGALSLAGDYFNHPKAVTWEERYQQFLGQIIQLAQDVEFGGGSMAVQPSHAAYDGEQP